MMFSQSIVYIDWCWEGEVHPVVRIFGSTPSGQNCLLHLHGCYPYLYVDLPPGCITREESEVFFKELHFSILSHLQRSTAGIRSIELVTHKTSIYGYHEPRNFGKITLIDPNDVKKVFEYLVSDKGLRVYEAHIGFIPQVMADYNLYGMDFIHCSDYSFRFPLPPFPKTTGNDDTTVYWCEGMSNLSLKVFFAPKQDIDLSATSAYLKRPCRTSNCALEVDVSVENVLVQYPQPLKGSMSSKRIKVVNSLIPWWQSEEERRNRLDMEFPNDEEEENSQATFACGDPFKFRERMRNAQHVSFPSQDTLEVIGLLEEMKQGDECREEEEDISPSQLSNQELLDRKVSTTTTTKKTVSFLASSDDDDDEDDEFEEIRDIWQSIAQSQVDFVEQDSTPQAVTVQSHSPSSQSPTWSSPAVNSRTKKHLELFYGNSKDLKTPLVSNDQQNSLLLGHVEVKRTDCSIWIEPVREAPLPFTSNQSSSSPVFKRRAVSQLSQASSLNMATPGNPGGQVGGKEALRTALEKKEKEIPLDVLALECFSGSAPGSNKLPDPERDPLCAIFYLLAQGNTVRTSGVVFVAASDRNWWFPAEMKATRQFHGVSDELSLFHTVANLVQTLDPDVLLGWEVQRDSFGYLLHRAKHLKLDSFVRELSRVPFGPQDPRHEQDLPNEHSGMWIPGRIVFNFWRLVREELKLSLYSLPNVLFHTLGEKLSKFSQEEMTIQWKECPDRLFAHFFKRVEALIRIADHLDVFGRSSEVCGLLGLDLFSSLTRGSQFRVESLLRRVCGRENVLLLSPTREQVASQKAMESCPLILEPQSKFYANPVCVFDFRSLYPSVIIAYNICYSTCLGRIGQNGKLQGGLGCDARYEPISNMVADDVGFISPNGVCFLAKHKRVGILPRILEEILATRVMVKKSVQGEEGNKSRKRLAESRQYGLKMIANLTYGYTAASYSGRMPCVEVAETIVETARSALEFAMEQVKPPDHVVVFGDTDSLFVHLPTVSSLMDARKVGTELTQSISRLFPRPIKLQFEKVYFPCILQVKKRYVGWKFPPTGEGRGEEKGSLDAKGIETIRRDGCPALVKTLELVLKELFTSFDLSKTKACVLAQLERIFEGSVSMSDFILTGKVKLGSYAKDRKQGKGNYPPAAVVGDRLFRTDAQAKPQYKERIPYLVACGPPQSRLVDLVVDPLELITKKLRINVAHYIFKIILPALFRVLNLCIPNASEWFIHLERTRNLWGGWRRQLDGHVSGIHRMFDTQPCVLCRKPSLNHRVLCSVCNQDVQRAKATAEYVLQEAERKARDCLHTCSSCILGFQPASSSPLTMKWGEVCINLDCEDFYKRNRALNRVRLDFRFFQDI